MSRKYKFYNPDGIYFVTFATINWIDVFTRRIYKDILVESINYCIQEKGMIVYAWVIMSNHVHLLMSTQMNPCEAILRDLKKFTSKKIIQAIEENPQESRKVWMLQMMKDAGSRNPNNEKYQFWQQDNHPIEVSRNTSEIDAVIKYIHENPVKVGFVDNAEDYPYSSAVDFAGGEGVVGIYKV
jgi:REP element-mobilizing transposase RayT